MANPTFLDLKTFVAAQLGNIDQGTYVAKRESLINLARRQFYSEEEWSFLVVPATSVTMTALSGPLPSDYNIRFSPRGVYTYSGNVKYQYEEVPYQDLSSYAQDRYVYSINRPLRTIVTNVTTAPTLTVEYVRLPADRPADTTEDSLTEAAPTITAIGYLAISMWWLSKERSTSKFQLFDDKYKEELRKMVQSDQMAVPPSFFTPYTRNLNQGYQSRSNG